MRGPWDNTGRLIAAPHKEQGFPDLDFEKYGLKKISCVEKHGWIWSTIDPEQSIDAHIEPLIEDLEWLGFEDFEIHAESEKVWDCNWKILVEGGLEAYHFRVAHAKTIGTLFSRQSFDLPRFRQSYPFNSCTGHC